MSDLPISIFGDLRTAEVTPIFQGSFEYTVDNIELTENVEVGGGTVTQADAMAVVGTSTTTGSTAKLSTRRHARYRAGLGAIMRFTVRFSAPAVGADQLVGMADESGSTAQFKNGLMIGYVNGVFGFHRFSNDVLYSVPQTDWANPLDGSGSGAGTLDHTKLNVFFISFGYLGVVSPELHWMRPSGEIIKVHTIRTAGVLDTPHSYNPNYHFIMWADNGATSSDVSVRSASYGYFVEGKTQLFEIQQPEQTTGEVTKSAVTTEVAIFTIRNKLLYNSKDNFIDIMLQVVSVSIEASSANNLGKVRLVQGATLGGTPVFNDIDTADSVVDYDTAGTTVTGGKELIALPLAGKNDKVFADVQSLKFILSHGDTITLAGSSVNSATIKGSCLWKELF
jgi:hypothetical protein